MRQQPAVHPKVLVLDGASKAAAECVLALDRTCEVHVSERTERCVSFASRRLTKRFVQPVSTLELGTWIQALDQEEHYDLIVPATEISLLALKDEALGPTLRAKAVIPSEHSIDVALDKQQTVAEAVSLGIKSPWGVLVTSTGDIPSASNLPSVLKPVHSKVGTSHGAVALSVQICRTETERHEAYQRMLPLTPCSNRNISGAGA